jgi:hypothetical protein
VSRVEIFEQASGIWSWRYVDPGHDLNILSNHTFDSREAAEASARRAYPEEFGELPEETQGSVDPHKPLHTALGALFAGIILLVRKVRRTRA